MAEDNGIHRRRLMATAGITALAAPFIARGGSAIAADGEMMETKKERECDRSWLLVKKRDKRTAHEEQEPIWATED